MAQSAAHQACSAAHSSGCLAACVVRACYNREGGAQPRLHHHQHASWAPITCPDREDGCEGDAAKQQGPHPLAHCYRLRQAGTEQTGKVGRHLQPPQSGYAHAAGFQGNPFLLHTHLAWSSQARHPGMWLLLKHTML